MLIVRLIFCRCLTLLRPFYYPLMCDIIVQVIGGAPENVLMPYFTVYMVIWSTFFIEFWRQRQAEKAMMWGVVGYEALEQDRPQFEGEVIKSPIDGKPMKYFASGEKNFRSRVANVSTTHVTRPYHPRILHAWKHLRSWDTILNLSCSDLI
jgi:Calcium-activated chloride channel